MARIRSIKPEFWTSEEIVELSPTSRLLFVGMWTFCDDRGIHPASCKTLKMEVFPGDDFTAQEIEDMMSAIISAGLVLEYQANDGKKYWAVTGWDKHQKVEKPNFKHPAPPQFDDQSTTNRRPIDDQSTTGGKGKGREKELEGKGGAFAETRPAIDDENENIPNPTQASGGAFAEIRASIQDWQNQDNGEALRKIATDQKFFGQIEPEITRFITNNLAKDPYRDRITRNPVGFFKEQFPGWLCLPAAQRASKAQTQAQGQNGYTKPVQRPPNADERRTKQSVLDIVRKIHPAIADQFSDKHIQSLQNMASERALRQMIESIASTIKVDPRPAFVSGNAHKVSVHGLNTNNNAFK